MWFVIREKRCTEMNKASLKSLVYFLGDILIQKRGRGEKSLFSFAFPLAIRRILVLSYPALPWALSSLWNSGYCAKNLLPSSSLSLDLMPVV